MIRGRSSVLRAIGRVAALLALLSVLTPLEPLLPDAHDRDAVVATLDGGEASVPSGHHRQTAPVQTPEHRTHVDHCTHAHLLALSVSGQQPRPYDPPVRQAIDTSSPRLESVSAAPHQRPPIA